MNNKQSFSGKVFSYQTGRPTYAPQILQILKTLFPKEKKQYFAADVGCGTGIFSELLLQSGFFVYGVEPSSSMLLSAAARLSSLAFSPITGCAENIPLPDHSIDLIACAQSFHWFDRDKFRSECDRVLNPNGLVLLIWNSKDIHSPIIRDYQQICLHLCKERFTGFHNGINLHGKEVLGFFHTHAQTFSFPNNRFYSKEKFLNWCLSSSYSPQSGEKNFEMFLSECEMLFVKYESRGCVLLPSNTIVHIGN